MNNHFIIVGITDSCQYACFLFWSREIVLTVETIKLLLFDNREQHSEQVLYKFIQSRTNGFGIDIAEM